MAEATEENLYLCRPKDRARTFELWEGFQSAVLEEDRLADPYARVLFEEWARCRRLGVDPAMRQGVVLPPGDFEAVLRDRSFLLGKARPSLEKVAELLRGVPGIVLCTDERGTILHIVGDPAVRGTAAEVSKIVEGSCWLESIAGTNGIGTAIARRTPVHVFSTEHFCEGWHRWTCAASPIFDPLDQKILGVVDFTTLDKDYREDAVALTHSLARSISAEIQLQLETERMRLIHAFSVYSSRYPSDAVAVFDRLDRVVRSSAVLETDGSHGDVGESIEVRVEGSDDPIGRVVFHRRATPPHHVLRRSRAPDRQMESYGEFVTREPAIKGLMERIQKVVPTNLSILLIGETGTGKELVSQYIHDRSGRRAGPFVAVNCGTIGRELFESTFFGYERGAFTGADPRGRKGLFESAAGGTLFLDEMGEMPLEIQAGLLRVLETGRFRRVGSSKELEADCRIIAATNRPLAEEMKRGSFRSDLYYRLSVATFTLPPLRERRGDIPILVEHMAGNFCRRYGLSPRSFTESALGALSAYGWPGNARELRNVLESTIVCAGDPVELGDLPPQILEGFSADALAAEPQLSGGPVPGSHPPEGSAPDPASAADLSFRSHERKLLLMALARYRNVCHVAKALGVSRSKLYRMFRTFDIDHTRYLDG